MTRYLPLVLLAASLLVGAPGAAEKAPTIESFALTDPRTGEAVALKKVASGRKAIVVVFLGTECPLNNAFMPVLADLHATYGKQGVAFLGINSNSLDTPETVAKHALKAAIPFPVLKDPGNVVADKFAAERTPEAFVLDPRGHVLYRGRIDDRFGVGVTRPRATQHDLARALDEILAGKAVSTPRTRVEGCIICRTRKPKAEGAITYTKDVASIVRQRCQECHRPGRVGPMSLLTYEDAVAWSGMIREVVSTNRMPPWHADPKFGTFANDRRLTAAEKKTLLGWLEGGLVKGDPKDMPAAKKWVEGWQIGKPDLVLEMEKAFDVPAETPPNGVPYQYLRVPTNFKEDRWVTMAEARPGAPEVVHHIIAFIVPPGQWFRMDAPGAVLCGMAPGDMPLMAPPGTAKLVPAGSTLVFQMHYTPNGKAQKDRSRVGLIFAKEPPKYRILTRPIHNTAFITHFEKIPAGASNFEITSSFTFRKDAHIVQYMPHMHLRGKDFRYEAIYPDGKRETLLFVPRWEFGWQSIYTYGAPRAMPKGTKLLCTAHFDNSANNPNNPDPKKDVYWGDQTWEEMMIGWIDYYNDEPAANTPNTPK